MPSVEPPTLIEIKTTATRDQYLIPTPQETIAVSVDTKGQEMLELSIDVSSL